MFLSIRRYPFSVSSRPVRSNRVIAHGTRPHVDAQLRPPTFCNCPVNLIEYAFSRRFIQRMNVSLRSCDGEVTNVPTYSYECKTCGHTVDILHAMNARRRVKCPECGGRCRRLLGAGAALIFKGSGFYETDYKKNDGKKAESKGEAKTEAKSEGKTEGKTENKTESKAESKAESKSESSKSSTASSE